MRRLTEKRKAYIRKWQRECIKNRKAKWLKENGPCRHCGSSEKLEVDHIDRQSKKDHRVWSWKKERRESELLKCQVLCKDCHKIKTSKETSELYKDRPRITSQTVPDYKFHEAMKLLENGLSQRKACAIVGMSRSTFSTAKIKGRRKHLFEQCPI